MRALRPSDLFCAVPSPGFIMRPPVQRHGERIPPEARAVMQPTWQRGWFGPRDIRICVLENVIVAQEGLVFTADGSLLAESVRQHTGNEVAQARAMVAAHGHHAPVVRGDVVLCRKRGAVNYGHWIVEMLPMAWLAAQHWPHPLRVMVQELPDPMRAVQLHSLARLGLSPSAVVPAGVAPVRVERLIFVDGLTEHGGYLSPLALECLDRLAGPIAPDGPDMLWISRGAVPTRRLQDEDAILASARRAGFTVLDPSTLPFAAQIAVFKAARRIVGVMGAALANMAFCRPGADLFALAPAAMSDTFFWFLAGLTGLAAEEIRCEQTGPVRGLAAWDRDVQLDLDVLARLFDPAPLPAAPGRAEMDTRLAALFAAAYYLAANPDVAAAGVDPLDHYMGTGWREGRNPSAAFDTRRYLTAHPDIGHFNPLAHFIMSGEAEGRAVFAVV